MPLATDAKLAAFRDLHTAGCFVIPNPWDADSARYLEQLGFKALATTSSGCAWSQGRRSRPQIQAIHQPRFCSCAEREWKAAQAAPLIA